MFKVCKGSFFFVKAVLGVPMCQGKFRCPYPFPNLLKGLFKGPYLAQKGEGGEDRGVPTLVLRAA